MTGGLEGGAGQLCLRQSGCMQLQCNSISGAFLQYSLQYFVPAGTTQWQLGWAHFLSVFWSAIRGPSWAQYAPRTRATKAQPGRSR